MENRVTRDPNEYNVRAVERALDILGCFDDAHPARGITEIAEVVGLHKATVHRIVTTLVNHGYLERLPGGQNYRLGMQLAALGFQIMRHMDLRRDAMPYMAQLAAQCEETCDLSIFDRGEVFYIEVLRSRHALTLATAVGQRMPAHATASGKLFLAFLPEAEREALLSGPLKAYTTHTIIDLDVLREQLALFRIQGYGFDDEEYEVGVRAVSAPICNRENQVIAVLSIPGPISRVTTARLPELLRLLTDATQAISRRMGWQG